MRRVDSDYISKCLFFFKRGSSQGEGQFFWGNYTQARV